MAAPAAPDTQSVSSPSVGPRAEARQAAAALRQRSLRWPWMAAAAVVIAPVVVAAVAAGYAG